MSAQRLRLGAREIESQADHLVGDSPIVIHRHDIGGFSGDLPLDCQLTIPVDGLVQVLDDLLRSRTSRIRILGNACPWRDTEKKGEDGCCQDCGGASPPTFGLSFAISSLLQRQVPPEAHSW